MEGVLKIKKGFAQKRGNNFFINLLIPSLIILISATNAISSEGISMVILKPIEKASTENKDNTVGSSREAYETRKGTVNLNTQAFYTPIGNSTLSERSPISLRGKAVQVGFFDDKLFNVVIERENIFDNKTILLSGKIVNSEISTFTLTLTEDSYIINLQDIPNSMLYRVVGNTSTGIGNVTEIDQKKLPPMIGLPPLIPPTNE